MIPYNMWSEKHSNRPSTSAYDRLLQGILSLPRRRLRSADTFFNSFQGWSCSVKVFVGWSLDSIVRLSSVSSGVSKRFHSLTTRVKFCVYRFRLLLHTRYAIPKKAKGFSLFLRPEWFAKALRRGSRLWNVHNALYNQNKEYVCVWPETMGLTYQAR